jgi:hypothetical protein
LLLPPGRFQAARMRRFPTALLLALAIVLPLFAGTAASTPAEAAAQAILQRLDLHLRAPAGQPASGLSGGNPLSRYAAGATVDPLRVESAAEYARRTLAGAPTARLTPEATGAFLREQAASILASADQAPAEPRLIAELGRYHARRLEAAIHYQLFLRSQRLAELVAATYAEKDAVEHWRAVVRSAEARPAESADPGVRPSRVAADWRAELGRLEASLRDLEEQCCPPDASVLQEKVWRPRPAGELTGPAISPVDPQFGPDGGVRIAARIRAPSGVAVATLRFRAASGQSGFASLPMNKGADGEHTATLPSSLVAGGTLEYFIEAIAGGGAGASFPEPGARPATLRFTPRP